MVLYLPLAVFVFVLLFPFYWMTVTALKPNDELTNFNDFNPFWPENPTLRTSTISCSRPPIRAGSQHDAGRARLDHPLARRIGLRRLCHRAHALPGSRWVGLAIFLAYLVPPSILFIPLAVMVFNLRHLRLASSR